MNYGFTPPSQSLILYPVRGAGRVLLPGGPLPEAELPPAPPGARGSGVAVGLGAFGARRVEDVKSSSAARAAARGNPTAKRCILIILLSFYTTLKNGHDRSPRSRLTYGIYKPSPFHGAHDGATPL